MAQGTPVRFATVERRMRRIVVLLSVLSTQFAGACCIAHNGTPVQLVGEQAVIIWDSKSKIQHFVRQATFDTKAKDFGFIVPTPTPPDLAVASNDVFPSLGAFVEKETRPPSIGCSAPMEMATKASAGSVDVLSEQNVGDYKAVVIRATDGAALNNWLKSNGYISRPAMVDWFNHYIAKDWVFTALKYRGQVDGATETHPVRVSFKTDKPHFPYKMPEDTWPKGWRRPLQLYFVSDTAMDSRYVGSSREWEAKRTWSGPMPNALKAQVANWVGLKPGDLPSRSVLTAFTNGKNSDGYSADLEFSSTNASLASPASGGLIGMVIAWMFFRRKRAKSEHKP